MIFPRLLKSCLFFALIISCQALCLSAEHSPGSPSDPVELLFLTWAEYIDPNVVQEFERKFNVKVREIHFETVDARDDMLVETDGSGYDVIVVNTAALPLYHKRRWLAPINVTELPNLKHIDAHWMNAVPQAVGYGVPYSWGITGIAYRADLIPEKITSWWQLFQPSEALRSKIIMVKNARNVIGMALKALGYSTNSTNPRELEEAEQLLLDQRPYVKSYSYVSLSENSELLSGQALAAMMYNGDALMLSKHNPNIAYVVPEEGTTIWVDFLAILQSSSNRKLAMEFINFLNEPENAARLARFTHYATPNKTAERLLPAEFLHNPVIYPGKEVLENSEFNAELPPRAMKQRNSIFARLLQ